MLFFCFNKSHAKDISLEIFSIDSVYNIGYPVPLKLKVKNFSDSVITIPYSPYLQKFVVTYVVCDNDTLRIEHPVYSMGHGRNPVLELEPDNCLEYPLLNKYILIEDGNYGDNVFYKPGIYKIFCLYDNLRSNEIILKIIDTEQE
jgi:hypothetical protein